MFALAEVAVHLRPEDNVAVAAKNIPEGAEIEFLGERCNRIVSRVLARIGC